MFAPVFAALGSKVPVVGFVIPVPDQVPPVGVADRFVAGSVEQKSPGFVMFITGVGFTVIVISSVSIHEPVPTV